MKIYVLVSVLTYQIWYFPSFGGIFSLVIFSSHCATVCDRFLFCSSCFFFACLINADHFPTEKSITFLYNIRKKWRNNWPSLSQIFCKLVLTPLFMYNYICFSSHPFCEDTDLLILFKFIFNKTKHHLCQLRCRYNEVLFKMN